MPLKYRPMRFGVKIAQIKKVAFFKMNYKSSEKTRYGMYYNKEIFET